MWWITNNMAALIQKTKLEQLQKEIALANATNGSNSTNNTNNTNVADEPQIRVVYIDKPQDDSSSKNILLYILLIGVAIVAYHFIFKK